MAVIKAAEALREQIRQSARKVRSAQDRELMTRADAVAWNHGMPVDALLREPGDHIHETRYDRRAAAFLPELDELRERAYRLAERWRRQRRNADRAGRPLHWHPAAALDALRGFHAEHGRWPQARELTGPELPSRWTVRKLFGGLPAACAAAAPES